MSSWNQENPSHFQTEQSTREDAETCADLDFMYDRETLVRSSTFIDDALKYRSIFHKVDSRSLRLYDFYFSRPIQWTLYSTITVLHLLAFFENPSSISWSSDIRLSQQRKSAPCGLLETLEFVFLVILLVDAIVKSYLIGKKRTLKSKWLIAYFIVLCVSFIDLFVTVSLGCSKFECTRSENCNFRLRRLLRPFFLLQKSSLMKKVWNCLRRTMVEILSVLLLLLTHLYFFTMLGMLIFPTPRVTEPTTDSSNSSNLVPDMNTTTIIPTGNQTGPPEDNYFRSFNESFINLLVLLTTANNPDVMMPAYEKNRFSALYFIVFLVIGLYCIMNMLTAVIYNQFRGYFKSSMQSSLFRRRIGILAAFEVLRRRKFRLSDISVSVPISASGGIPKTALKKVAVLVKYSERVRLKMILELDRYADYITCDQLQQLFDRITGSTVSSDQTDRMIILPNNPILVKLQYIVLHRVFSYFGCLVIAVNVIMISVLFSTQYDQAIGSPHSFLHATNLAFNSYYVIEKILVIWAHGLKRFKYMKADMFDTALVVLIVILEVVFLSIYGGQIWSIHTHSQIIVLHDTKLWQLVKTINLLLTFRIVRLVTLFKSMSLVLISMLDIIRNLAPFGGLLLVLYYVFGILGLELFFQKIKYTALNSTQIYDCGSYEQLQYWANNFDDFGAALVVLWDVMVVNNWHIFLHIYSQRVTPWSQLYFVIFWILSVIISVNLFTAIILENFIMRWDRHKTQVTRQRAGSGLSVISTNPLSVHDLFKSDIQEPSKNELLTELKTHEHFSHISLAEYQLDT